MTFIPRARRAALLSALLPLALLTGASAAAGVPDDYRPLYADRKAYAVGDTVQVVIVESIKAESSAGTGAASATGVRGTLQTTNDGENGSLALGGEASGNGQTTRSGSVRTVVTVRVTSIDEYGNLRLEGAQEVVINDETQEINVAGTVRPDDIAPDNTVPSNRLAESYIRISGVGAVANAQRQGIVFRFLKWLRIL